MALTRAKKSELLKQLVEDWKKAKSAIFSGYSGLSVKDMSVLRKELRAGKAQFRVAKKTLVRLAAKELKMPEIPENLTPGAVGVVFGFDDPISPAKKLAEFAKTHPQITLLGGMMDGKLLTAADAKYFASLPGKQELLAKLVGTMKAPISGFHGVLSGVLRGFVMALSEVAKKRGAEGNTAARHEA